MGKTVLLSCVFLWITVQEACSICVEPSNVSEVTLELQTMIKENYLEYMPFLNLESFFKGEKNRLNKTFGGIDVSSHHSRHKTHVFVSKVYGEYKCMKKRQFWLGLNQTTSEMSSCPWYYVLEIDNDRIPSTVIKAKCSCKNCLVPTQYRYSRYRNGSYGYCKEVSYRMPMIRRDCFGGIYRYRIAIEDIPVGCTCQMCNMKRKQGRWAL